MRGLSMTTKVMVTGASGFLGKAVCHKVRSLKNHRLIPLNGKADWDLTKQKYVDYALQQYEPDVIIHLAARVGGIGANKENPGLFMYENLAMGMNLIESCRKYQKLEKFIMVGTVCAYPKFTPVPFREENLWNGYPEETNAPYGIAKKALMELLVAYKKQYDFNAVNLIPVNMYGPNDNFDPAISHVIPALILKIDRAMHVGKQEIELWGTGEASREFLYVDDCADAIIQSLSADISPSPLNIGTGREIKIKELIEMLKTIMGYGGNIIFNSDFPDGQPRRCLDTTKARKALGFSAKTHLYDGLRETVSWYHTNKDKYKFHDYFDHIQ
jgi:GDP-L-fucose synthase